MGVVQCDLCFFAAIVVEHDEGGLVRLVEDVKLDAGIGADQIRCADLSDLDDLIEDGIRAFWARFECGSKVGAAVENMAFAELAGGDDGLLAVMGDWCP